MSLTCEEELHWIVRIVHNLSQAVEVAEEEVCTLVSSETTSETDGQSVRIDLLNDRHDARWVTLMLQPILLECLLDVFNQLCLQSETSVPNLLIWHVIDSLPNLLVRLVCEEVLVEVLGIDALPLRSSPSWHVHTVGHIAHVVEFLWEVTLPDAVEHVLRHLAVQPAHAVHP